MKRLAIPLLSLLLASSLEAGVAKPGIEQADRPGVWSNDARDLFAAPPHRPGFYPSPDGKVTVLMEDNELFLKRGETQLVHATHRPPAEVLWAPDSLALAVTWNDGGGEGAWNVTVYRIEGDAVKASEPSQMVRQAFLPSVKCADPELPDIGAVAWTVGSSRLLLAARVPQRPGCSNAGAFSGYEISIPEGRIEKTLTSSEVLQRFAAKIGRGVAGN
jgi:hypothetical protein